MRRTFWIALSLVAVVGAIVILFAPPWSRREPRFPWTRSKLHFISAALLEMEKSEKSGGRFVSAIYDKKTGEPLLSWRVKVLPYLGRMDIYLLFHLDEPWDSEHNKTLREVMPDQYRAWGPDEMHDKTVFQVPTGAETILSDPKGTSLAQITDGPRNTILVVETDAEHAVPWTKPEDIIINPRDPAAGLRNHDGFFIVARPDGSLAELRADTNPATLWSYFTRAGGEKTVMPDTWSSGFRPTKARESRAFASK
jgi:hypothetical protein